MRWGALWLVAALTAAVPLWPVQRLNEMKQLQSAALQSPWGWQELERLCDGIGPRLSGSPQAAAAVVQVATALRAAGLTSYLEPVTVRHWVRGEETASLVGWPGATRNTTQKIVLTALGGSTATPREGLTAEVVVVDSFDALEHADVRGRIVLFNTPFDTRKAAQGYGLEAYEERVEYRTRGASEAARHGAVAMLVRSIGSADFRLPHTGNLHYADGMPCIPAAAVSAEDADLLAHLTQQGAVRMHLTLTPQTLPDAQSANVTVELKGREHPEQVVVMGGHLDSWDLGTGAIDDGCGVVACMDALRLMHSLGLQPARTIRAVAWMNEENGLAGARAYAAAHHDAVAAIESDLGAGHPVGYVAHCDKALRDSLDPVLSLLGPTGTTFVQPSDESPGADIWPLDEQGVPTFEPLQDSRHYFDWHHTAADTLDKVNPHELQENTSAIAVLAWALATRSQSEIGR
ncbi:MAG: M20/M25/M40 family metallo-hydrolase [Candidatus Xenobia bacterium]